MYAQPNISQPEYGKNTPMIDIDFDIFEMNSDFGENLREADAATFYHDAREFEE